MSHEEVERRVLEGISLRTKGERYKEQIQLFSSGMRVNHL